MPKTTISLSIEDGIIEEIKRLAVKNNRSVSNMLETMLTEYLIDKSNQKIKEQSGAVL